MPRKKKDPARVAAGKKAWAKLSPAKKAASKKRLAKFRFPKGGGTAAKKPSSRPAASSGGGTTGETKKRPKIEPIPVIGVRGSATKVSAPKILLGGSAVIVGFDRPKGETTTALEEIGKGNLGGALAKMERRAAEAWKTGRGKAALALLGGFLLFGKAVDRRFKDFPIRFGR